MGSSYEYEQTVVTRGGSGTRASVGIAMPTFGKRFRSLPSDSSTAQYVMLFFLSICCGYFRTIQAINISTFVEVRPDFESRNNFPLKL
jgi:hypothetical protein